MNATATQTFILDGCSPGGTIQRIEYTPRGPVVLVVTRYPTMPPHTSEMTLAHARQHYANKLALGTYRRIA